MDEWRHGMWRGNGVGWSGRLGGVGRGGVNKCERGLFWLSENPLCLMAVGEQECGCAAKVRSGYSEETKAGECWAVGRLGGRLASNAQGSVGERPM